MSDALSGIESVKCNAGSANVTGTSFTCEQQLAPGDNQITMKATDRAGNVASSSINVTRQEGDSFRSATLRPNVIFVGESEPVTFTAKIPYEGPTPPAVRLLRLGNGSASASTEGMLLDDGGESASGDRVRGDAVFTFQRTYTAESEGQLRFQVSYEKDGRELSSQVLQLGFHQHLTDAQIDSILSTQQSAAGLYENLAASTGKARARDAVLADLRRNPNVLKAGVAGDGTAISVLHAPGIMGTIYLFEPGVIGGSVSSPPPPTGPVRPLGTTPRRASTVPYATAPLLQNEDEEDEEENRIQSKRALVYAAMNADFDHWGKNDELRDELRNYTCDSEVDYYTDGAASVENFKNLQRYGIIIVSSHGGMRTWDTVNYASKHNLPAGADVYEFLSGEVVTDEGLRQYESDLFAGLLGIGSSPTKTYFTILPPFVSFYSSEDFPNSLVYFETCFSTANDTMAQTFFRLGAKTFLGYSKAGLLNWNAPLGLEFFQRFLGEPERKVGGQDGAFIPDQYDFWPCLDTSWNQIEACNDPAVKEKLMRELGAKFMMFGSEELKKPGTLINGGFETGDLDGWGFTFDSRAVGQLGDISPVGGEHMGMVSKVNTWFGWLQQDFCMPPNATRVEFDWNLITEQGCGSFFSEPDVLWIRITGPGLYHQLLTTGVREQCSKLKPTSVNLPSDGSARATGWQHASIDITNLAQSMGGEKLTLVFEVRHAVNNGDTFTDSAVLIDNVKIVR